MLCSYINKGTFPAGGSAKIVIRMMILCLLATFDHTPTNDDTAIKG